MLVEVDWRTNRGCIDGASEKDAKVCSVTKNKDPARDPFSVSFRHFLHFLFENNLYCRSQPSYLFMWEMTQFGCAIASSRYSNITELADMVQIYYQAEVFRTTYQTQNVHPFPPQSEWEISGSLMVILFLM
uniref:Uncharacterized protein n=1 Tax=Lactuca sativa TaxID=4236 RepID=A0A9R1WQ28_LACSA|nr:hypothetical protein LSAT_V11C100012460 [Lactuca sativa]